ncbi:MAG: response regulator [Chitinophagaceae bacterium]|nr:MAG: response regulator [Chitinophagaceae bacterium]
MVCEKTILVVDDNKDLLEMVAIALHSRHYEVATASAEFDMMEKLKESYPDIILLDVLLNHEDGRSIAKKLKQNPNTAGIPIILYSVAPITPESMTDSQADCFLAKPFDLYELFSTIKRLLPPADQSAGTQVAPMLIRGPSPKAPAS